MLKLLTAGGFGDAAMSFAKLQSKDAPFKFSDEFFLTHVRIRSQLSDVISDFYRTQDIPHRIVQIPNWDWLKHNRQKFDYYTGTKWKAKNENDEETWEINPFPAFKYKPVQGIDIVLNPVAGRMANRSFPLPDIRRFVEAHLHRNIVIVGKLPESNAESISKLPVKSLVNTTTIEQLVNIICSCNVLIGHPGFTAYVGCMAQKQVLSTRDKYIDRYFHPHWNAEFIGDLAKVRL